MRTLKRLTTRSFCMLLIPRLWQILFRGAWEFKQVALGLDLENLQRRCDISIILSSQIYPERMAWYRGTSESLEDLKPLMCEACFSFAVVSAATGFLQWSAQVSQLRSSRFLATVCAANGLCCELPEFLVCEARVFLVLVMRRTHREHSVSCSISCTYPETWHSFLDHNHLTVIESLKLSNWEIEWLSI